MKQPTSDGSSIITMCQPIVMMFRWPLCAELTKTTGPGSKKRRTFATGKSAFLWVFMRASPAELFLAYTRRSHGTPLADHGRTCRPDVRLHYHPNPVPRQK